MAERSLLQYQPVTGPVWREPVAEKLAWLPAGQQPVRTLPPNRLGDFVRPEFEALYKAEGLQWSPSDRYFGRAIPRELPRSYVLDPIPPASPQHLTWVPVERYSGKPLSRSQRDFTIWPPFEPLYDPENLQWIPSDRYAGRALARSTYDSSVLVQLVTAAAFDPQTLDWQPRDRYFGRAPARSLVDWSVLQGEPIVAPPIPPAVVEERPGPAGRVRRRRYIMPDGRMFEATTDEVVALLQLYAKPKLEDKPRPEPRQAKGAVSIPTPQVTLAKRDIRFLPARDAEPDTWKVVIAERFIYAPPEEATRQAQIIANRMRADEDAIIALLLWH